MAFIRRVRTASGATAVQIVEYATGGRQRVVQHGGSAHTEAELGVLLSKARELLTDSAQGVLDLDVEPALLVTRLVAPRSQPAFFEADQGAPVGGRDRPGQVVGTDCQVLFEALARVYTDLGFDTLGDEVFRDLVLARVVEPTSLLDSGRVLTELGRAWGSYSTLRRTLTRAHQGGYRDQVATTACFEHAASSGDVSLVLYDVTTLYFEAENEDDVRKVAYSKERRVDPQIMVGLLVDRAGFSLEIGWFEGNRAETTTIIPIMQAFQARPDLVDMVVVADAGMLSGTNLAQLDKANLRFIVGSQALKAPLDLASRFRWHGDSFSDAQVIDTLTPRGLAARARTTPSCGPSRPGTRSPTRARGGRCGPYSRKRAVRDDKTLTLQENRAKAVIAGEKAARRPRFVKTSDGTPTLDQASLARARRLLELKG